MEKKTLIFKALVNYLLVISKATYKPSEKAWILM